MCRTPRSVPCICMSTTWLWPSCLSGGAIFGRAAAAAAGGQRHERHEGGHQRRLEPERVDGWWAEAYDGTNGWALPGDIQPDHWTQDARDAGTLYRLLEQEVVPAFYDRDAEGLPRAWLARVRASLRTLAPALAAGRMLQDYVERIYAPTRSLM